MRSIVFALGLASLSTSVVWAGPPGEAPAVTTESAAKQALEGEDEGASDQILARAIQAHGVGKLTLDGDILFEFVRTLPDGRVAEHVWAQHKGVTYLKISGEAEGFPMSVSLLAEHGAWLSVDGGPWEPQNEEKVRMTMGQLSPKRVVPLLLVLEPAAAARREFERMEVQGEGEVSGHTTDILRFDGDRTTGELVIQVDRQSGMVRQVAFEGGKLIHTLSAFQHFGELTLPAEIVTQRTGQPDDHVRIKVFDVEPKLDASWFKVPE